MNNNGSGILSFLLHLSSHIRAGDTIIQHICPNEILPVFFFKELLNTILGTVMIQLFNVVTVIASQRWCEPGTTIQWLLLQNGCWSATSSAVVFSRII